MSGPGVGWYLIVAAILFGVGALGVMMRRSPLIVLLSLEIMLNAGNLTLIAFARQLGDLDGQIFALAVMVMFLFVIAYLGGRADAPWRGGPRWQTLAAVTAAGALLVAAVGGVILGHHARRQREDD